MPGLITTFFPWFLGIVCSSRLSIYGCNAKQQKWDDPTGQDASGRIIKGGNVVLMGVKNQSKYTK